MKKLRVVIADDERPARELLKRTLLASGLAEIVGEAENGPEAIELIRSTRPDLAMLDLQMPRMNGIDAVRQLAPGETPLVAFVTAFDEFAAKAFDLNAVDYLLKPVESGRLTETLLRAAERLRSANWRETESSRIASAAASYPGTDAAGPIERIPVKVRDEIRLVPVDEIASIVADGELLRLSLAEHGVSYVINFRLKDIESRLDASKFVRVSRGAIVNMAHVESFIPIQGGTYSVRLSNGSEIPSSRQQSKVLREQLLKL